MSNDRTTEILNYLTAISRDVGELRAEVKEMRAEIKQINTRLEQVETRLEQIEARSVQMDARLVRMERDHRQRLDRIAGAVLTMRADVDELQDRVVELESKQA